MGNSCGVMKKGSAIQHVVIPLQRPRDMENQPDFLLAQIGPFFLSKELSQNPKTQLRMQKWNFMITSQIDEPDPFESFASRKTATFKRRLRKGPPVQYRWSSWMAQLQIGSKINQQAYKAIPKPDQEIRYTIKKDLDRTFPDQPYFDKEKFGTMGQKALYNVLWKFATSKPTIGYCQSLNFIAAFMLLISGGSEVEVYYMLVEIWERFNMEGLYKPGMPYLQTLLDVFNNVFQMQCGSLYAHFQSEGIPDHIWIGKWLMTLGIDSFPLPVVVRIWDCFVIDGFTFIMKTAMALVKILQELFLEISGEQICEELKSLKDGFGLGHLCPAPDMLIPEAGKISFSQKKFTKLCSDRMTEQPESTRSDISTPIRDERDEAAAPQSLWSSADTQLAAQRRSTDYVEQEDSRPSKHVRSNSDETIKPQAAKSARENKSNVPQLPNIHISRDLLLRSESQSDFNDRDDEEKIEYNPLVSRKLEKDLDESFLHQDSIINLPGKKDPEINQHISFINNRLPM